MNNSVSARNPRTDPVVDELVDEFARQLQAGQPVDADEFANQHPEHAARLRLILPAIQVLADLGGDNHPCDAHGDSPATGTLGDFRILREIGAAALGDRLLYYMLQYCRLRAGVVKVSGVTRCKGFDRRCDQSLKEYISNRDANGWLLDPMLNFHERHGARVLDLVAGYRPEDENNLGHGVLIEYDLLDEPQTLRPQPEPQGPSFVCKLNGAETIQAAIRAVLGDLKAERIGPDVSLMDAGLDSLHLQELRLLLSRQFQRDLDSTFFFRNCTPRAIADYLFDKKPTQPSSACEIHPVKTRRPDPSTSNESIENHTPQFSTDPIAIIGIGCRLPGGISGPEGFWQLLAQGLDAISEVPTDRWDKDALYDANPDAPGKMWTRRGGFLDQIDQFDAAFFGISPREAASLDPQQRLLLEVVWEALENAGRSPSQLAGSRTGVFVGLSGGDYERLAFRRREAIDAYCATGTSASTASGRISYFLDLHGPCFTVDTACSSSLVAVHLASQSLRLGECETAIAAGVNVLFPEYGINFTKARMLSPHGVCKTFDAAADGYVRGEGCGVLILKPLSKARADGDSVLAVLLSTGLNQDGRSNGLTAPNGTAQEALLRQVLADADVKPNLVRGPTRSTSSSTTPTGFFRNSSTCKIRRTSSSSRRTWRSFGMKAAGN